jgi:integrase/recombinase XerD
MRPSPPPSAAGSRPSPACSNISSATTMSKTTRSPTRNARRLTGGKDRRSPLPRWTRPDCSIPRRKTRLRGLRDPAILSVGLQVGLRRAETAALSVEDLHQNRGFDSLRIVRKGGRRDALAIHPNAAQRIRAYLDAAGHADDLNRPMFRPLSHNPKGQESRRHMDPGAIDRVPRKHATAIGMGRGHSTHSMRATFVTTALENGATLDDVQRAAGHAEPGTTKLYDRRGYNPEKSASFFATY